MIFNDHGCNGKHSKRFIVLKCIKTGVAYSMKMSKVICMKIINVSVNNNMFQLLFDCLAMLNKHNKIIYYRLKRFTVLCHLFRKNFVKTTKDF